MNEQDSFFDELGSAWRQQPADVPLDIAQVQSLLLKTRRAWHMDLFGAGVALAAAVLFWSLDGYRIFDICAVVMLVTAVVIVVSSFILRKPVMQWGDWTVSGLLNYRLAHCRSEIRNLTAGIYSACFLYLFVAFMWLYETLSGEQIPLFSRVTSSLVMGGVASVCIYACSRKRNALRQELRRLAQLRKGYKEE